MPTAYTPEGQTCGGNGINVEAVLAEDASPNSGFSDDTSRYIHAFCEWHAYPPGYSIQSYDLFHRGELHAHLKRFRASNIGSTGHACKSTEESYTIKIESASREA